MNKTENLERTEKFKALKLTMDKIDKDFGKGSVMPVSYTHLRAHETVLDLVCRLLLEKKKKIKNHKTH